MQTNCFWKNIRLVGTTQNLFSYLSRNWFWEMSTWVGLTYSTIFTSFLTEQTFDRSLHHYLTDNWDHITAQIINDLFYQNKTTWNLTFSKSDNMLNYLKSARRHWRRTSRGEITSGSENPEISRPEVAFHAVSSSSL